MGVGRYVWLLRKYSECMRAHKQPNMHALVHSIGAVYKQPNMHALVHSIGSVNTREKPEYFSGIISFIALRN